MLIVFPLCCSPVRLWEEGMSGERWRIICVYFRIHYVHFYFDIICHIHLAITFFLLLLFLYFLFFFFPVPLEHCRANSALPPRQLQYI